MDTSQRSRSLRDESAALPRTEAQSKLLAFIEAFVFYSLVVTIGLVAIPYGTVEPWWEARFECVVFILGLLWTIHGLCNGAWTQGSVRVFYPMIALVALALLQSLPLWQMNWAGNKVWYALSADPFESRRFALKTGALILAGVMLVRYTGSRRRLSVLVHAIIGVALLTALFGFARARCGRGKELDALSGCAGGNHRGVANRSCGRGRMARRRSVGHRRGNCFDRNRGCRSKRAARRRAPPRHLAFHLADVQGASN